MLGAARASGAVLDPAYGADEGLDSDVVGEHVDGDVVDARRPVRAR